MLPLATTLPALVAPTVAGADPVAGGAEAAPEEDPVFAQLRYAQSNLRENV